MTNIGDETANFEGSNIVKSEDRKITLWDGEVIKAKVSREPDREGFPTCHEVRVDAGVSTGESDAYGDNPTHAWSFPCDSIDDAVSEFTRRIDQKRIENCYYETR